MSRVLVAVKNNKLAQTIMGACQDRGEEATRLTEPVDINLPFTAPENLAVLVLNLDDLSTRSDKKIIAFIENLPPSLRVLGLGSNFDLRTVTAFFRAGLYDYLSLPPDPLDLSKALTNLLTSLDPSDQPKAPALNPSLTEPTVGPGRSIIGQSQPLLKLFRLIEKIAASDATVMIQGESGTGKELIARAIHNTSPRKERPLIPVNCGAIPEELLEAEFFGHEKGAFTGAVRERIGRFEMAEGGTIFLDEIGDMSPKLQVKLLRVLQEREFERVGGQKSIEVDIRVITATNLDLPKAVAGGRFREDLFYRLNVIPLLIPPLRERSEDIPLLIDYFLDRLRKTRSSKVSGVDPETLRILMSYPWPGNIRELENLLERMVILAEGDILTNEDLPPRLLEKSQGPRPLPRLASFLEPDPPKIPSLTPPLAPAKEDITPPDPVSPEPLSAPPNELSSAAKTIPGFDLESFEPRLKEIIQPLLSFPADSINLKDLVEKYEDALIGAALTLAGGVKNEAARRLSINRTTLVEKIARNKTLTTD
ncbi:MAG: sigma-54 dependent transcriptional regulator [Deltaproteobacteria bacterium]|jgi:DNA-binding NtrC family response regulator|nr:sigma-54 dependent transcriptional regulator [Deltaproteobacteria bacterium]